MSPFSLLTTLDRRTGTRIAIEGPITRHAVRKLEQLLPLLADTAEGPCPYCGDDRPHRHVFAPPSRGERSTDGGGA